MFEIVKAAGWPIWFLIATSVTALALIVERFYSLRSSKIIPPGLLAKTLQEYSPSNNNADLIRALEQHSPLGQVLASGIRNVNSSREIMKESIEETGRSVVHEMERFLSGLGTIATLSPLMGLFGTIVGMIEIFASQTPGNSNPALLAHGISVALYNTGLGLLIAMPSLIFWRFFRARVDDYAIQLERQAIKLVEVLHGDRT